MTSTTSVVAEPGPLGTGSSDTEVEYTSGFEKTEAIEPVGPRFTGEGPPNGGLTAWLVVFGVWCTSICSFGWLNSTIPPQSSRLLYLFLKPL